MSTDFTYLQCYHVFQSADHWSVHFGDRHVAENKLESDASVVAGSCWGGLHCILNNGKTCPREADSDDMTLAPSSPNVPRYSRRLWRRGCGVGSAAVWMLSYTVRASYREERRRLGAATKALIAARAERMGKPPPPPPSKGKGLRFELKEASKAMETEIRWMQHEVLPAHQLPP